MLILNTTELAIWWVAVTPLAIPATKAINLLRAEAYRELAEEPVPPGETPPMPWRPRFVSGLLRASADPLHERIRRRVMRTVPRFIVGAVVLWVVAINVASVITLPRNALIAIQALYCGLAGAYGFISTRTRSGRLTARSRTAALTGLVAVAITFVPLGPD